MNKLLVFFGCFVLVSCVKNTPPVVEDRWAAERVLLEMVSNDTGAIWKVDEIALHYAQWNADSLQYYFFYSDTIHPSGQRFHFKNVGVDSGAFITTDTIARLLRIPLSGKYTVVKGWHMTSLTLKLQRDSEFLQVNIERKKENERIIPDKLELFANYQIDGILYLVSLSLSPG